MSNTTTTTTPTPTSPTSNVETLTDKRRLIEDVIIYIFRSKQNHHKEDSSGEESNNNHNDNSNNNDPVGIDDDAMYGWYRKSLIGIHLKTLNPLRFPNRSDIQTFLSEAIDRGIVHESGTGAFKMLSLSSPSSSIILPSSPSPIPSSNPLNTSNSSNRPSNHNHSSRYNHKRSASTTTLRFVPSVETHHQSTDNTINEPWIMMEWRRSGVIVLHAQPHPKALLLLVLVLLLLFLLLLLLLLRVLLQPPHLLASTTTPTTPETTPTTPRTVVVLLLLPLRQMSSGGDSGEMNE